MANLNIDLPITSKKAQALTLILNPAELVKIILGQGVSPVIEKIEEEPSASADVHIPPAPKKRISRKKAAEDSILEEVIAERDFLRQQLADLQTQYALCQEKKFKYRAAMKRLNRQVQQNDQKRSLSAKEHSFKRKAKKQEEIVPIVLVPVFDNAPQVEEVVIMPVEEVVIAQAVIAQVEEVVIMPVEEPVIAQVEEPVITPIEEEKKEEEIIHASCERHNYHGPNDDKSDSDDEEQKNVNTYGLARPAF